MRVRRPNREFLLDVRNGKAFKNYSDFHKYAYDLIEKVRALEATTPLQKEPDMKAINDLIIGLQEQYWAENTDM